MKRWIVAIWKDPVWSKVISAAIIAGAISIWGLFDAQSLKSAISQLAAKYEIPLWALLLLLLLSLYSLYRIRQALVNKRTRKLAPTITNDADIKAILDDWWQRQGANNRDVTIRFQELEAAHNLAVGSVGRLIDAVAHKNGYRENFRGENHATYSLDISRGLAQFNVGRGF